MGKRTKQRLFFDEIRKAHGDALKPLNARGRIPTTGEAVLYVALPDGPVVASIADSLRHALGLAHLDQKVGERPDDAWFVEMPAAQVREVSPLFRGTSVRPVRRGGPFTAKDQQELVQKANRAAITSPAGIYRIYREDGIYVGLTTDFRARPVVHDKIGNWKMRGSKVDKVLLFPLETRNGVVPTVADLTHAEQQHIDRVQDQASRGGLPLLNRRRAGGGNIRGTVFSRVVVWAPTT